MKFLGPNRHREECLEKVAVFYPAPLCSVQILRAFWNFACNGEELKAPEPIRDLISGLWFFSHPSGDEKAQVSFIWAVLVACYLSSNPFTQFCRIVQVLKIRSTDPSEGSILNLVGPEQKGLLSGERQRAWLTLGTSSRAWDFWSRDFSEILPVLYKGHRFVCVNLKLIFLSLRSDQCS